MAVYNLLTLHAGKMLENYNIVQLATGNHKVEYSYDLSSTSAIDREVILSDDQYEDNALFHQLKKCIGISDAEIAEMEDPEKKNILKQTLIFIDFKDVFFKEKNFDVNDDYKSLSVDKLKSDDATVYRLLWMFDAKQGGVDLVFDGMPKDKPVTYVPFEKSSSMARSCQITFIRKDLKDVADEHLMLGIDFSPINVVYSKFFAYRGLYLSTGYRIEHNTDATRANGENTDKLGAKLRLDEKTVIVLPDDDKHNKAQHTVFTAQKPDEMLRLALPDADEDAQLPNGLWECGKESKEITLNSFDGEGLLCPEYAEEIRQQLTARYKFRRKSHSFQIRMPFTKGMLHEVNFHRFMDEQLQGQGISENDDLMVEDIFKIKRNLRDAKIILTKSMFKCAGWLFDLVEYWKKHGTEGLPEEKRNQISSLLEDPMKFFFQQVDKYDHSLYVTGSDARLSNDGKIRLNYQFLSTLNIDFTSFDRIVQGHVKRINKVRDAFRNREEQEDSAQENTTSPNLGKDNADRNIPQEDAQGVDSFLQEDANEVQDDSTEGNAVHSENVREKCLNALARNEGFITDPQVRDIIDDVQNTYEKNLCIGRLEVSGEQRYLSRDLLSMLINILRAIQGLSWTDDEKKTVLNNLQKECLRPDRFYMPKNRLQLNERFYYGILRNPHLARNEQCMLRPYTKNGSIYETYFRHLTGIIMVGYKSLSPMALSGADFDGDLVKIVSNRSIVEAIKSGVYETRTYWSKRKQKWEEYFERSADLAVIDIPAITATSQQYPDAVPFSNIKDTFSNQVGQISNIAVKLARREYAGEDEYKDRCAECTIVTGLEIDAAKTGTHPKANIDELRRLVQDDRNVFLKAKDSILALERSNRRYTPQVLADGNTLSMYISKQARRPVTDMDEIQVYDADNPPQAVIDHLPGQYLLYLRQEQERKLAKRKKRKEQKNETEETSTKKRILFCFQTQDGWKKSLNEEDKTEVAKLVLAYVQIRKLARQMTDIRLRSKTSKYAGYILTILQIQYDGVHQNLEGSTVMGAFNRASAGIKQHLGGDLNAINKSLERFVDAKWQFTYDNCAKEAKIAEILGLKDDESLDLSQDALDLLCNFSNNGFMILYYILKDIQSRKYEDIDAESYIDDESQKDDAKFAMPLNNPYYNELYQLYAGAYKETKKSWNSRLVDICRKHLLQRFGDMSLALRYVIASASIDTRREFLWNVFSEDEILWNVYAPERDVPTTAKKEKKENNVSNLSLEEMAKSGDKEAIKQLGNMYLEGLGVDKDIAKAEEWYLRAADLCDMDALHKLGKMYRFGEEVPKDIQKAVRCYRKLADLGDGEAMNTLAECYQEEANLGDADAMLNLGILYAQGHGIPRDNVKAINLLQKASEALLKMGKSAQAADVMVRLGRICERIEDMPEAANWYEKAAANGSFVAMNLLGDMHKKGLGVQQDDKCAAEFYEKAVHEGNADSMCSLGKMYQDGCGVHQNYDEAEKLYLTAAKLGNSKAMRYLGDLYCSDSVKKPDIEKSIPYYRKAFDAGEPEVAAPLAKCYEELAKSGDSFAMLLLGKIYDGGRGLAPDYTKAVEWYKKSADAGNMEAVYCLGTMSRKGRGVPKDCLQAVEYYQKSAETGNVDAMNHLADIYTSGEGEVEADVSAAKKWLEKAEKLGSRRAANRLNDIFDKEQDTDKDEILDM